jgi:UDP-glucose 4-epimerase
MNGPVLVTGGAGYIGGHAVLCLKDHGRDAVVLDNLSTRNLQSVPDNVTFVEGDVGDQALVQRVISEHRCTAVLHFAGSIVVSESVDAPLTYYQNNVAAGIALIQACVEEGVKQIIFSSTAAVYGANAGANTTEDTETMSLSPYGRSKQMMEDIIKDAANAHGTAQRLRTQHTYLLPQFVPPWDQKRTTAILLTYSVRITTHPMGPVFATLSM